jgi:hypothetical protein
VDPSGYALRSGHRRGEWSSLEQALGIHSLQPTQPQPCVPQRWGGHESWVPAVFVLRLHDACCRVSCAGVTIIMMMSWISV